MTVTRQHSDKLVVVIDDDALVLEATHTLLRSWGFEVVAAQCVDDALKKLSSVKRRPDLIICDYQLSKGVSGIDAIEGLRNAFEIPALLISGDGSCPPSPDSESYQLLHKPLTAQDFRTALADARMLRNG